MSSGGTCVLGGDQDGGGGGQGRMRGERRGGDVREGGG